ncbi:isoamyl alcohol oxidase, putative [Rhizoctonia solani AG-3 Rhs1AP]|uniref:Isoamyl alcohol oxidase, putative n=1 Tax=Rhizoctonia solani AG-3 Rhs1AP TaxID=1086054 RepID=X8JG58_9AGAM|nr:isoamyl alcohol oxidase, putative [Rhizoctonia solani AG-3 Rhs1AP]
MFTGNTWKSKSLFVSQIMRPATIGLAVLSGYLVAARSPYDIPNAEWDALNITVGGRLARGVPFSRACFSSVGINVTGVESNEECTAIQRGYVSGTFRASKFGSAIETQWETCQKTNEGCLLDPNSPTNANAFNPPKTCHQGGVSPYYIAIETAGDVSGAFAFSKRTGVPLVIKNSGHDYTGRSLAPGTLALWINYSTSFVSEGCNVPGAPVMTFGAGQDMGSIYEFAEQHDVTFIGGSGKTVGAAGGWIQGGGHSVLSNKYGMGVDRVRQFRVVTPDGVLRVANSCQNTDLFWALRGGGGGTFGVVMEASIEVVPHPALQWEIEASSGNLTAILGLITNVASNSDKWVRDGWGGYIYPTYSIVANPSLSAQQAKESLKDLTNFLTKNGIKYNWHEFSSFMPLFETIVAAPIPFGVNAAIASRLIPVDKFAPLIKPLTVAKTLETFTLAAGKFAFFLTSPFNYNSTEETSIAPVWRDAIWHAVVLADWAYDASSIAAKLAYTQVELAIAPLRLLTPGGSSYQNEGDVYEPNWETSFWGSNYDRLRELKQKFDPDSLLDCWHCVGWKGKNTPIASCYF